MTAEEADRINRIPFLFIVGKGRSGTTLLQSMLNAHPKIVAPAESMFIPMLYPRFRYIKKYREKDILKFVDALYHDNAFAATWNVNKEQLIDRLVSIKDKATFSLLCKVVCCSGGQEKEASWISFKTPDMTMFTGMLPVIFPGCKFIHLVREPRDNVLSHLNAFNAKNTAYVAEKWLHYNLLVEKYKEKDRERFLTILYEELVSQPEDYMRKVCQFLQLPYYDSMIQHKLPEVKQSLENTDTSQLEKVHGRLFTAINTSNIGGWKSKMKAEDIVITEAITYKLASKRYGYDIKKPIHVPYSTIIKAKWLYYWWEIFTRFRYRNYGFNIWYTRAGKRK